MAKAPRLNEQIRISPIRLIDEKNEQRGVVETYDALRMSRELGLDLVEIAPHERPPVCRIMDYGKHKYILKKKQKQQQSHEIVMKEVRLRPKTDDHDRDIKLKRAGKFVEAGHKVQFTMLFRGRERQHRDLAFQAFQEIIGRFTDTARVERPPKFEGKRMTMVLAPLKKGTGKGTKPSQGAQAAPGESPPSGGKAAADRPAGTGETTRAGDKPEPTGPKGAEVESSPPKAAGSVEKMAGRSS